MPGPAVWKALEDLVDAELSLPSSSPDSSRLSLSCTEQKEGLEDCEAESSSWLDEFCWSSVSGMVSFLSFRPVSGPDGESSELELESVDDSGSSSHFGYDHGRRE